MATSNEKQLDYNYGEICKFKIENLQLDAVRGMEDLDINYIQQKNIDIKSVLRVRYGRVIDKADELLKEISKHNLNEINDDNLEIISSIEGNIEILNNEKISIDDLKNKFLENYHDEYFENPLENFYKSNIDLNLPLKDKRIKILNVHDRKLVKNIYETISSCEQKQVDLKKYCESTNSTVSAGARELYRDYANIISGYKTVNDIYLDERAKSLKSTKTIVKIRNLFRKKNDDNKKIAIDTWNNNIVYLEGSLYKIKAKEQDFMKNIEKKGENIKEGEKVSVNKASISDKKSSYSSTQYVNASQKGKDVQRTPSVDSYETDSSYAKYEGKGKAVMSDSDDSVSIKSKASVAYRPISEPSTSLTPLPRTVSRNNKY